MHAPDTASHSPLKDTQPVAFKQAYETGHLPLSTSLLSRLAPTSALRDRSGGGHVKVTNMELFFDLVYVFSIIQLSHFLLEHQTWTGALEAITLFAAVWWAWNYTA